MQKECPSFDGHSSFSFVLLEFYIEEMDLARLKGRKKEDRQDLSSASRDFPCAGG